MAVATSTIATADGARLIERLCAHWGHKFEVETTSGHGRIAFDATTEVRLDAGTDSLRAVIETPETGRLAQLQDVVGEHLQPWRAARRCGSSGRPAHRND